MATSSRVKGITVKIGGEVSRIDNEQQTLHNSGNNT
mgnify:CR=1 FL=1